MSLAKADFSEYSNKYFSDMNATRIPASEMLANQQKP
jgi:hypothetical protein